MCDEKSRSAQAGEGTRIIRDLRGINPDVYLDKNMTADEVNRIHRSAAKTPPKYTEGKPKFELIFPEAMLELAKIRTAGAEEHGPNSWSEIKTADMIGAAHRHLNKIERGMRKDDDSGFYHAAHLMCQAMFLFQKHFSLGVAAQTLSDRLHTEPSIDDLMQKTRGLYHNEN